MEWYEKEIKEVEKKVRKLDHPPATLFYGSSSIRLWNTLYHDFKPYCPFNLGFGGSTLEACVHYFPRVMKHLHPKYIVIYAGDNDLGDGKTPQQVLNYFLQLNRQIRHQFGNTAYSFISIKPSMERWEINEKIKQTNHLIKEAIHQMTGNTYFLDIYQSMLNSSGLPNPNLYEPDGLHLSSQGYQVWKQMLLTHISSEINSSLISC